MLEHRTGQVADACDWPCITHALETASAAAWLHSRRRAAKRLARACWSWAGLLATQFEHLSMHTTASIGLTNLPQAAAGQRRQQHSQRNPA